MARGRVGRSKIFPSLINGAFGLAGHSVDYLWTRFRCSVDVLWKCSVETLWMLCGYLWKCSGDALWTRCGRSVDTLGAG